MAAQPTITTVRLSLPPGRLGVGVRRDGPTGSCAIRSRSNRSSPLEVGDVVLSLNGIVLADVEGGVAAWTKLFRAFDGAPRNVTVQRGGSSGTAATEAPTEATAAADRKDGRRAKQKAEEPAAPDAVPSAEAATASESKPEVVDLCSDGPDPDPAPKPDAVASSASFATVAVPKPSDAGAAKKKNASAAAEKPSAKKRALKPSNAANAGQKGHKKAKKPATKKAAGKKSGKPLEDWTHDENYMTMISEGFPKYGRVSPCRTYYITVNNDTLAAVAEKLGMEGGWSKLNDVAFNRRFYGKLTGKLMLKAGTILKIDPARCSTWKLNKLVDNRVEEVKAMATCSKCGAKERPGDADEILLCDGCDLEIHVSCAGLAAVPPGDFLCEGCLAILDARRDADADPNAPRDADGVRSLRATLPPLPTLDGATAAIAERADRRFREEVTKRRERALGELRESQAAIGAASRERVRDLAGRVEEQENLVEVETSNHNGARNRTLRKHGLRGWTINNSGKSHIKFYADDGSTGEVRRERVYDPTFWRRYRDFKTTKCPGWDRYYQKVRTCSNELNQLIEKAVLRAATDKLSSLREELAEANQEERERPSSEEEDKRALLLGYADLLSEPRLDFELKRDYDARYGFQTMYLGIVKLEDADVRVLNIMKEPTEFVLSIPVDDEASADAGQIEVGAEYYLFGTAALFSSDRNDCLPMDFAPTSMRTAQRDLMAMLLRDPRNRALQVTEPAVPSSVALRGTRDEALRLGDITKCFDLGELVRDCHYPILGMPSVETPKRLADHGLVLRDYQKTSLKWLLDKESNPTGMGSSGELWSRMRGLNVAGKQSFYYCDLTGSIVSDIFSYKSDINQADAAQPLGDAFPSSAIIGSEMGLGKTVIALSLVVASPPSKCNRMLPRENIATIKHPAYFPPPSVKGKGRTTILSNCTLVIAPTTLCPQWQAEIKRFAPWMSVLTLHNEEGNEASDIASKDIVICSTFLLANARNNGNQRGKCSVLLQKLRRIHFHRIFLDESHLNNSHSRSADNSRDTNNLQLFKSGLASLSSSYRYCVTGTPVGQSLTDLYGQLRFLRVPQFCREDFWVQNIEKPYGEHNCSALTVLRSLLSRIVIRHSKEQTVGDNALLELPPRTVETLMLPFATETERNVYAFIENRNIQRFKELRSTSPATVLSKYTELFGLLVSARQACGHAAVINLDDLHNLNLKLEREKEAEEDKRRGGRSPARETKKKSTTRAEVFKEAVDKARSMAKTRMREAVMELQSSEIEFTECPICLDATSEQDIALTPCAHKFCAECILSCLETVSTTREASGVCPECRDKFNRSEITFLGDAIEVDEEKCHSVEAYQKAEAADSAIDINGFHLSLSNKVVAASGAADRRIAYSPLTENQKRSQRANLHTLTTDFLSTCNESYNRLGTKMARLLEEIKDMIKQDGTSKAVVFSQYLGTLELASEELAGRGIKFSRVDAMMKQHQRADNIISFTQDPSTKVLLLSMKAGAAGLNLVCANYCFIVDPALNSAAEEQAIDRLHRIGQTRPVIVKRLIIKDSIEERILENRRSLAADRPTASTLIDGTGSMEEDAVYNQNEKKRDRNLQEDQSNMGDQTFQRLQHLEALFGCSATIKAVKG
ncbi:hypothetical protein ACHAWF_013896 [Thalassiosira exigua]